MLIAAIASSCLILAVWVLLPFEDEIPRPRYGDRPLEKEARLIRSAVRIYGPIGQLLLAFQVLLSVGFNASPDPSGWFSPERQWLWSFCSVICLVVALIGAIAVGAKLDLKSRIAARPPLLE